MNIYYYIYHVFIPLLIITFYDGSQQIMYHLVKKFQVFSTRNSICHTFGPPCGVPNWIRSNAGINHEWRVFHEPQSHVFSESRHRKGAESVWLAFLAPFR